MYPAPSDKALPQWATDFEAAAKQAYPSASAPHVFVFRRPDGHYALSAYGRERAITETTTLYPTVLALALRSTRGRFGDAQAHLDALERCSTNARS